jgi:hypothetical protein
MGMARSGIYKFRPGERVRANEKAPGDFRGRHGTVIGSSDSREYEVRFDGDEVTNFLDSDWLDQV